MGANETIWKKTSICYSYIIISIEIENLQSLPVEEHAEAHKWEQFTEKSVGRS